jgi:hypothetical protein
MRQHTLIDLLLRRRLLLAGLILVVSATVIYGTRYTSLDSTDGAILSDGDPYKPQVERVRADFPGSPGV